MKQPDFTNKRTVEKIKKVIVWCKNNLRQINVRYVSAKKLDEIFGNTSHPTSCYLREVLLIRSGHYIVGKQTFSYRLNLLGLKQLEKKLAEHNVDVQNTLSDEIKILQLKYANELNTCNFQYSEKSNRYYHPIQNLKKEVKTMLFANSLPFNYDIQAAGPTITYYSALLNDGSEFEMQNLKKYIKDPSELRTHLQKLTKLDRQLVKDIINGIMLGARLIPNNNLSIFKLLEKYNVNDPAAIIKLLKSDEQLSTLREELNYAWKNILGVYHRRASFRSAFYFEQEKKLLKRIKQFLKMQQVKFFTEHDGFRTNIPIDTITLEDYLAETTGIWVKIIND